VGFLFVRSASIIENIGYVSRGERVALGVVAAKVIDSAGLPIAVGAENGIISRTSSAQRVVQWFFVVVISLSLSSNEENLIC